jgi:hypothetical protein
MPNLKLHRYTDNAPIEIDSNNIVYRMQDCTKTEQGKMYFTHLALPYGYTLNVRETPEQFDILLKGGSLEDWTAYDANGSCPVIPTRKVLVKKRLIKDTLIKAEWTDSRKDYTVPVEIIEEIPEVFVAGELDWNLYPTRYCEPIDEFRREDAVMLNLGITHYKVIGY